MSALSICLRHSSHDEAGLSRRRRGRGFSYHDAKGRRIECSKTLTRIKGLGLPPAYKDVWICQDARGHLQAVGTDVRGRRQYRYHADWRRMRDNQKFDRLEDFGRALVRLREQVEHDMRRKQPDRIQVSAALVRLIDRGALRVGSERYAEENRTFGATTLRSRHLKLDGPNLRLSFQAKGGKRVRQQIKDATLARILGRIDDLPGRALFSCLDVQGNCYPVLSDDVNAYIADASGDPRFTAKTFRTWHGTVSALETAIDDPTGLTIGRMSEAAAERPHNTEAIARKSYIHPHIIELAKVSDADRTARLAAIDLRHAPQGLPKAEKQLISLLSQSPTMELVAPIDR